jgi:quaternary ammonium compound-resistance protein SugE
MAWIQLVIAGLFEVVWATSLKYTEGLLPSIITIAGMVISFYFFIGDKNPAYGNSVCNLDRE